MLFNSYLFIFLFMPAAVLGFFALARLSKRAAVLWLFAASLFFYGWWDYRYVWLLLGSITVNYYIGKRLTQSACLCRPQSLLLTTGICANLAILGYYKYAEFFVTNAGVFIGSNWSMTHVVLPIGISFFTFTQIAYLVDAARGEVREYDPLHYGLFVTYFPHLVAGPILHHKEIMPQFSRPETYQPQARLISAGLAFFAIGLAKKVLLADSFAPHAEALFAPSSNVTGLIPAWIGVLSYTFQIYFDFSGYSDMAIGLSLMLGVRLPINFDSPYKATSIIEFWRRWHMTLSRFLRDYLYMPLGGNRRGPARRYLNLMTTMVLGGFWHGAAWTFVAWGALHGVYLMINHGWRALAGGSPCVGRIATKIPPLVYIALTFLSVMVAWVFFRAENLETAFRILKSIAGIYGVGFDPLHTQFQALVQHAASIFKEYRADVHLGVMLQVTMFLIEASSILTGMVFAVFLVFLALPVIWLCPNSQQLMNYVAAPDRKALSTSIEMNWTPALGWALCTGSLLALSLYQIAIVPPAAFLYFNF